MSTIVLEESGVVVHGQHIDVAARDATRMVTDLLGPEVRRAEAGVRGVGRTAHWLNSGVVVVSQDVDDRLIMLYFCFDPSESIPYPQHAGDAFECPAFQDGVEVAGHTLRGRETERLVRELPGVDGIGGMLSLKRGELFVGLSLMRARGRFSRRTGARQLVSMSAEWGGRKPFQYPPRRPAP